MSRDDAAPARARAAHKEARGEVTVRLDPNSECGIRATCAIRFNELTIFKTGQEKAVLARVSLDKLQVTVWPNRPNLFGLASSCNAVDDIVCCADSEDIRNELLAVFRRLGIDVATKLGADEEEYLDAWLTGVEIHGDALKARLARKVRRLEEQQARARRELPSPTWLPSPAVVHAAGAGNDQKREAHDTPASERTESALSSADTPNAHDAPDCDRRTCKCTTVGRAVREEPVVAGVRARMCASADSFAAGKSLAVVADVERSAGPHHGRLVLRRGDRSGDIIASLLLMPESLQLAQVNDQVVEMLPVAPGQSRSTVPLVYLAFKNSARFERFRRMVGDTACPLV